MDVIKAIVLRINCLIFFCVASLSGTKGVSRDFLSFFKKTSQNKTEDTQAPTYTYLQLKAGKNKQPTQVQMTLVSCQRIEFCSFQTAVKVKWIEQNFCSCKSFFFCK